MKTPAHTMAQKDQKVNYLELQIEDTSSFDTESPIHRVPNRNRAVIHYALIMFSFAFTSILQPFILLDKDYYDVNQDSIGSITSLCITVQLIIRFLVAAPYGRCSGNFGRKTIVLCGAASYLLGCIVIALQKNVFPGFILGQILLANGTAILSIIPFPDHQSRTEGKASALSETFVGSSGLLACLIVKFLFLVNLPLGYSYIAIGAIVSFAFIINSFGLGEQTPIDDSSFRMSHSNLDAGGINEEIKGAINTLKTNGWVLIAFVIQILGSANFFVFFTYMALYIISLFPAVAGNTSASAKVSNLQIIALSVSLLSNIGYGVLLEKKNKGITMAVTLFALGGGAFSFVLMVISKNYADWSLTISAVLMGVSLPGLFVIASYLGIKNFPPIQRKVMIAFTGLFGHVTYFVVAVGGGLLYDYWRKDGLFVVCTAILGFGFVSVITIYKSMISGQK